MAVIQDANMTLTPEYILQSQTENPACDILLSEHVNMRLCLKQVLRVVCFGYAQPAYASSRFTPSDVILGPMPLIGMLTECLGQGP